MVNKKQETESKPRVFVTQETKLNVFDASRFGELVFCAQRGEQIIHFSGPMTRRLQDLLRDFTSDDYILPVGDPAIMTLVAMIASRRTDGRVKLLKWDRQEMLYYVVELDLNATHVDRGPATMTDAIGG